MGNIDANYIMMLRMFERMLAVSFGGIAIYLGYRLFALLPTQADSAGKIELPGFTVVLSKAGPGIFFAAFGSVLLFLSFTNPITVNPNEGSFGGALDVKPLSRESPAGALPHPGNSATPQELARVRQTVQMLNCMQRVATSPRINIRSDEAELAVRDAKVALLESVWDKKSWGDRNTFKHWAQTLEGTIPDQLQELYLSKLPGCPE